MRKKKYKLVAFTDGDYRVYLSEVATSKEIREWNKLKQRGETEDTARTVTQSDNKDALIAMAKLARHDYVLEWEDEYGRSDPKIVDRTDKLFP